MCRFAVSLLIVVACLTAGCSKTATPGSAAPAKHEHHAPHGGTPVVLGDELYHLEIVRDAPGSSLALYVLDGEMENFIRIAARDVELRITAGGRPRTLSLKAVANPATGETVGDTAMFEGRADWIASAASFDAVLTRIEIKGTTFTDVAFNFPKGNDKD